MKRKEIFHTKSGGQNQYVPKYHLICRLSGTIPGLREFQLHSL